MTCPGNKQHPPRPQRRSPCLFQLPYPHSSHRSASSQSQCLLGLCHSMLVSICDNIHLRHNFIICSLDVFLTRFLIPLNSEHVSSLSSLPSDHSFPSPSLGLPSATHSPSLGLPSNGAPVSSAAPTLASRMDNNSQRSIPPHLVFSQGKDVTSATGGALTVRMALLLFACMFQKRE